MNIFKDISSLPEAYKVSFAASIITNFTSLLFVQRVWFYGILFFGIFVTTIVQVKRNAKILRYCYWVYYLPTSIAIFAEALLCFVSSSKKIDDFGPSCEHLIEVFISQNKEMAQVKSFVPFGPEDYSDMFEAELAEVQEAIQKSKLAKKNLLTNMNNYGLFSKDVLDFIQNYPETSDRFANFLRFLNTFLVIFKEYHERNSSLSSNNGQSDLLLTFINDILAYLCVNVPSNFLIYDSINIAMNSFLKYHAKRQSFGNFVTDFVNIFYCCMTDRELLKDSFKGTAKYIKAHSAALDEASLASFEAYFPDA